jgi:hypothetical protein
MKYGASWTKKWSTDSLIIFQTVSTWLFSHKDGVSHSSFPRTVGLFDRMTCALIHLLYLGARGKICSSKIRFNSGVENGNTSPRSSEGPSRDAGNG